MAPKDTQEMMQDLVDALQIAGPLATRLRAEAAGFTKRALDLEDALIRAVDVLKQTQPQPEGR
jgi:hypothetical protein